MKFMLFMLPAVPATPEERRRLRPVAANTERFQQMLRDMKRILVAFQREKRPDTRGKGAKMILVQLERARGVIQGLGLLACLQIVNRHLYRFQG